VNPTWFQFQILINRLELRAPTLAEPELAEPAKPLGNSRDVARKLLL
jgi:hypothetical protein